MSFLWEGKKHHFDFCISTKAHIYLVFATLVVAKFPPRDTKMFSCTKDNSQGGVKKHQKSFRRGILYFIGAPLYHFLFIKNSVSVEHRKWKHATSLMYVMKWSWTQKDTLWSENIPPSCESKGFFAKGISYKFKKILCRVQWRHYICVLQ